MIIHNYRTIIQAYQDAYEEYKSSPLTRVRKTYLESRLTHLIQRAKSIAKAEVLFVTYTVEENNELCKKQVSFVNLDQKSAIHYLTHFLEKQPIIDVEFQSVETCKLVYI